MGTKRVKATKRHAGGHGHCVKLRLTAKITDIEEKIRALNAMKKAPTKLVAECSGRGPITECPILEALDA